MKGFMIESEIAATNVGSYNKHALAQIDVDGGGLIALTPPDKQGSDVWTAAAPDANTLGSLWVAYNPSPKYAHWADKDFAGLSADIRDYTNLAGIPFTVFKPKLGDEIIVSIDNVDASGAAAVDGDILESKAGQTTYQRIPKATGATAGSTAFQIEWVGTQPFPRAKIGMDMVKVFRLVCIQE